MKADREKTKLAMARACMNLSDLTASAGIPQATVKNVIAGKSVLPGTLGRVARALGVDPLEIMAEGGE